MVLFEQLYQLIEHVEDQAKAGFKFKYGQKPQKSTDNYELYLNEIFFLNNTIIAEADNMREVFVIHESVNYLTTTNPQFCEETANWMQVQKKKSILITNSSERERNKFFKKQYNKIEKMMKRVMDWFTGLSNHPTFRKTINPAQDGICFDNVSNRLWNYFFIPKS